jgi:hypothetical protein
LADLSHIQPPRARHAAIMAASALGAVVIGVGITLVLGGGSQTAGLVGAALVAGSLISIVPCFLRVGEGASMWGMLILGASMFRAFLTLGLGLALAPEGQGKPFWVGLMAGLGVLLVVETAAAVSQIARMERELSGRSIAPVQEPRAS